MPSIPNNFDVIEGREEHLKFR